jgi:hypothetical protein
MDHNLPTSGYNIKFTSEARDQLREIEKLPFIGEALAEIQYTLHNRPYSCPIAGQPLVLFRVLKTVSYRREETDVPSLAVYFRIIEDDKEVLVLKIKIRTVS